MERLAFITGAASYRESLRRELRASGVKTVTICPGYIATLRPEATVIPCDFDAGGRLADKACAAIKAGAGRLVIPWQMGVEAVFMRVLPNLLFDKRLTGRPRKRCTGGP